jgi:hypothetical protein
MLRRYILFLLIFTNTCIESKDIIIFIDSIYNPKWLLNHADKPKIRAFWQEEWLNHLWQSLHEKITANGDHLKFYNFDNLDANSLTNVINKATYVIDARGNNLYQTNYWLNSNLNLSNKLILVLWEPRIVCPSAWDQKLHSRCYKILTWNDSLVDNQKYFLFRYPVYTNFEIDTTSHLGFDQKKLQCLIAGNKHSAFPPNRIPKDNYIDLYEERLNYINFCEQYKLDFNLYGRDWQKELKTYRGSIPQNDKCNVLSQHKFCISYENSCETGYVTEKIFDCYRAGCVPIYYGAYNIDRIIPKNCFIDRRDFTDNMSLYLYLKNMPKDQHAQYINNIQQYLSHSAQQFSDKSFVNAIFAAVN